jgi:hypothetical protein
MIYVYDNNGVLLQVLTYNNYTGNFSTDTNYYYSNNTGYYIRIY